MPTYEYKCKACGHLFEQYQSITAPLLKKCPSCGKSKLERLFGIGAAVVFKGGGFYQTDYRSESYTKAAVADKKAASESTSGASSSTASTSGSDSKSAGSSVTPASADSGKPGTPAGHAKPATPPPAPVGKAKTSSSKATKSSKTKRS